MQTSQEKRHIPALCDMQTSSSQAIELSDLTDWPEGEETEEMEEWCASPFSASIAPLRCGTETKTEK